MSVIIIEGQQRLTGEVKIHGAKNSALPVLAACLVGNRKSVIHNCPDLSDVEASIKILEYLGSKIVRQDGSLIIDSGNSKIFDIPENLMREMRSSIIFLGAVLAKNGKARLSLPGGCDIGLRPIDMHIKALKQLGAEISEQQGFIMCEAPNGLTGAKIALSIPSVGATENIMIAAATAKGTTTVINAAREPEISDLADYLNACGAKIHGAGEHTVVIDGVTELKGAEHSVIPDRITAATYMAATAVTQGKVLMKDVIPAHLGPIIPYFEETGCDISIRSSSLLLTAPPKLNALKKVRTMPYPGFPTDAQAPIMSVACIADGTSMFVETIFENRYRHVPQLERMGAIIKVEDRVAIVEGVKKLHGAAVEATDLRGGAAMVIAALSAEGETEISGISHIDRGYENITKNLEALGAHIYRR